MNNDLLEDDTVLAVEGTPITGLQHPTVVNMIKKCDTSIELAVATPEVCYLECYSKNLQI